MLIDYDQILTDINNLINEEKLEEIATLIDSSKRVYFYGIGSSGLVVMEIKSRFMRLGVVCDAITDKNNLIWTTTILDSSCLVIGLSLSGQTEEVMEYLDLAAQKGAATALLTTKTFSTTQTHKIFPIASVRNLCTEFILWQSDFTSIPLLIMLDIIYAYFQAIDREKKRFLNKQSYIK